MKEKLLLAPLVLLLCSFTPRMGAYGTVGITLYSYTEYTSSGSTSYGIGHSFVMIENNRSRPVNLGFCNLAPFSKYTLGLWGNDGSSTSSNEGWNVLTDGIFYNREAYLFSTLYDNPTDMVKIYEEVEASLFETRISNFRGDTTYLQYNAEQYLLLGYNCSNFAAEFFAIATADDFGLIGSPAELRNAMLYREDVQTANKSEIFSTNTYWRYTNNGERFDYPS